MYYPYLRGKQFEFLALRSISVELPEDQRAKVRPVIEPVKREMDTVALNALSTMLDNGILFSFILNPQVGEFESVREIYFPEELREMQGEWIPALLLAGDAGWLGGEANRLIEEYGFEELLVVLPKNEEVSKWNALFSLQAVTTIVCCDADSRSTIRQLRGYGKDIVRMDDCFQAEQRNKDFRGKEDQRFNDNVAFYEGESFAGFGDYATLPASFVKGGMLPWVVAIHMTYNRNEEEVWIHHFLSESNDNGTENIQGKFREAASQVKPFFERYPSDWTLAVEKLHQYVESGHYPGLGTLKRISIEHHISLMGRK